MHFENNKSREIDRCSFVCLPNKQHGMGFRRIMAELDGATIYGVWVCIVAACSQQSSPRQGWLTEDGKKTGPPWAAADIALKIGRPTAEVDRCLSLVASPRVGWLAAREVPVNCPPEAHEPPDSSPPTTLEGRKEGTEQNRTEGMKWGDSAKGVLSLLNEESGRDFRATETNLGFISERLSETGITLEGVEKMIRRQCERWKGTEQSEYLRPQTLFNKTKFDAYYAAKDLPANETDPRNSAHSRRPATGAEQRQVGIPAAGGNTNRAELLARRAKKSIADGVAAKTSPAGGHQPGSATHG